MFSNLHCHSYYSLLDSISSPQEIVDFAVDNKQGAVCISDHGTLSGMIESHKLARKAGIKCLSACEIYEVDDDQFKHNTKDFRESRYHLLLIAKNNTGLHNLINIVSYANVEGKYGKPRIDLDTIDMNGWGEGIICCSACLAGRTSRYLTSDMEYEAKEYVDRLHELFDDVYCEIQSHNTKDQAIANKLIYNFTQKYNYKYVITTDAHMIKEKDRQYQSMFVNVSQDRDVGESYVDCFMQTEDDVYRILGEQFDKDVIEKGINATQEIVDSCDQVDVGLDNEPQMPSIEVPSEFSSNKEYLKHLCYKTFEEKFGGMSLDEQRKRRERIEMELPVLYELDFTDYFIMLYMIANECRARGISLGYSRGSGGNCLCLFMLNVTQIDSVRWDLDFSRFANLGRRGSMADYDFDVDKERRGDMIQVMKDLFGHDNVCNISTFNTFSNKVAIRDIGKVFNDNVDSPYYGQIPIELRDSVAKIIPVIKTVDSNGEELEVDVALEKAIKGNKELEELYKKFPMWLDYAIKLSGLPKSRGMHASAIMVLPKNMKHYCSVCLGKDGDIMYESEMHALMDDINLIKMDCLGLKNLSIVNKTLQFAGLTWEDVDINHLDLNDKEVYDSVYKTGETVGVFQMESSAAREMLIKAQADNIEDVIVVNAANRPGTKDSFPIYCFNKLNPDKVDVLHPDLKDMFSQSCSVLLYQEQALTLLRYAGFPEVEVENGRRCVDENTLVTMADGTKNKIKNINVGDEVLAFNNSGFSEPKCVTNVFDNGYNSTYKIKTEHGYQLVATPSHKVLTNRGWLRIDELTVNDYLMTPLKTNVLSDDIEAKYKPRPEIMFLLGLLIGDGSLGDVSSIHFTNSDIDVINRFKECCNFLSRKKEPCAFRESCVNGISVDKIYTLYLHDNDYKNNLKKLIKRYNLNKLAGDKCLPVEFMTDTPNKRILYLLAGLFNTDGGYDINSSSIEYYSKSKTLVEQIRCLLLKFGIYSYIMKKHIDSYDYYAYTIRIQQVSSISKFKKLILPIMTGEKRYYFEYVIDKRINNKLAYNFLLPINYTSEIFNAIEKNPSTSQRQIGSLLYGYKKDSFKISKQCAIRDTKARDVLQHVYAPNTYKMLMSDYMPIKITSIEEHTMSHVYDIEVEDLHNYIANDIVVHNCIGKKIESEMKKLEPKFRSGLKNRDWGDEQIEAIWNLLLKQSSYCFNR